MKAEGPADASVFQGFCSAHDAALFEPIECQPYAGTPEQQLLSAYRSVCRELRCKYVGMRANLPLFQEVMRKWVDTGDRAFLTIGSDIASKVMSAVASARPLIPIKSVMEDAIERRDVDVLGSVIFEIDGPCRTASWGLATPEFDGTGKRMSLPPFGVSDRIAFFATHPFDGSHCVSVSWLKASSLEKDWVPTLLGMDLRRASLVLPLMMAGHCELTFFETSYWDSLPSHVREYVQRLASPGEATPVETHECLMIPITAVRNCQV